MGQRASYTKDFLRAAAQPNIRPQFLRAFFVFGIPHFLPVPECENDLLCFTSINLIGQSVATCHKIVVKNRKITVPTEEVRDF